MRVEVSKNFLSLAECKALNDWTDKGVKEGWLDSGITAGEIFTRARLTSRLYGGRFEYPSFVIEISERIRKFMGINEYPLITGHGRDGIVVSCTFPGGDVYLHKDPKSHTGAATLRCNIMTRSADSGGELYVGGEVVDIGVGDLHCYLASEFSHRVAKVQGKTSRVLWMFGAHVPDHEWESGRIKFGEIQ